MLPNCTWSSREVGTEKPREKGFLKGLLDSTLMQSCFWLTLKITFSVKNSENRVRANEL